MATRAVIAGLPVARLALYEPPWPEHGGGDEGAVMARDIEAAVADGRPGDGAAIFLAATGMPPEAIAGMRQSPDWAHFERLAPTLPYDVAQTGDDGVPVEQLAGLDVPVLVMNGADSAPFFAAVAAQAASALPDGTHRVLPGQGHGADNAVLAPILADFFT